MQADIVKYCMQSCIYVHNVAYFRSHFPRMESADSLFASKVPRYAVFHDDFWANSTLKSLVASVFGSPTVQNSQVCLPARPKT